MIFVEAFNIKTGGALELLKYFLSSLEERNVKYVVGLHPTIELNISTEKVIKKEVGLLSRRRFYKSNLNLKHISSIFCFGNYPPPLKLKNVKVVTLNHNLFLIEKKTYGKVKKRILYNLKILYLKAIIKNSDFYVFQSNFLKETFIKNYNVKSNRCLSLPFFDKEKIISIVKAKKRNIESKEGFVYISAYNDHKNFERLINVWKKLNFQGFKLPLYLTIDNSLPINKKIDKYKREGVLIENLGKISHSECIQILSKNKYSIFPSLKETFGLGLMEAQLAGAKVISSDLPYVYEIIEPSEVFNPKSEEDILNKLNSFLLESDKKRTKLIVENKINELLDLLIWEQES